MRISGLAIWAILWLPLPVSAETLLLMAEEQGCYWCGQWDEEISHIYPKTAEGKKAPLQRYDLHRETPDVVLKKRVHYTPTFILVEDGEEVGRIEGYPGEDFFWWHLTLLFERANIPLEKTG
ncbi:MAG: hypothetical protein AAF681_03820 [Pseudomonadota bacterium]